MEFRHQAIDTRPPCGRLGICLPTDLTGDGYPDLIVGGMGAEEIPLLGRRVSRNVPVFQRLLWRLETHLFWYENPGESGDEWRRHAMSPHHNERLFANALADVNGDGRVDLVAAQGWGGRDVYWYEQPEDPREPWTRHLINDDYEVYHDIAFGDVDNDGEPELVALSQEDETLFYLDVPEDPYREPWPEECRHVIDTGVEMEGAEIVDVDGDGENELIAGPAVYRRVDGEWERETIVEDWAWTRVAVGDVDDDGELEIVLTEGDSPHLPHNGRIDGEEHAADDDHRPGRVAWFDGPDWEMHLLRDDMFCPHTVQVADLDGDGREDIYVAEMGLGKNPDPEHVVFRNLGDGEFEERVVFEGIETHEAKAVDVNGDGRLDVIGKSYEPDHHVDVWYNEP
jgi:hypothetical protein